MSERTSPSPAASRFSWIGDLSTELSARRTGMSFERTRMSADRTLMSVIRTSLSLIGFGFTIFQFFQKLVASEAIAPTFAGRNFGIALVALGTILLILGIAYHASFMIALRGQRRLLAEDGLIHDEGGFPPSLTLITAVLLLLIGLVAVSSMVFDFGPFT